MRLARIDFTAIPSPIILRGSPQQAHRDPCGHYHDGVFRVWHSSIRGAADSSWSAATAVTESRDLITWSEPRDVTPRDRALNYSSPGNVIRYRDRWLMCLQTYPSRNGGPADHTARIFTMHSRDLAAWSEPELLRVKGPEVAREEMGRMTWSGGRTTACSPWGSTSGRGPRGVSPPATCWTCAPSRGSGAT